MGMHHSVREMPRPQRNAMRNLALFGALGRIGDNAQHLVEAELQSVSEIVSRARRRPGTATAPTHMAAKAILGR